MTKEELIKKLEDAEQRYYIEDRDEFGGSPEEAAERDGKCDAYGNALAWVEDYFKSQEEA